MFYSFGAQNYNTKKHALTNVISLFPKTALSFLCFGEFFGGMITIGGLFGGTIGFGMNVRLEIGKRIGRGFFVELVLGNPIIGRSCCSTIGLRVEDIGVDRFCVCFRQTYCGAAPCHRHGSGDCRCG